MENNNGFGNIAFDLPKHKSNVIKVIGVGGGGSNAINHMFQQGIKGVDFVICNTDAQALQNSGVPNKIQLGVNLTEGLGAGANPEIGAQAAMESLEDVQRMLDTNTKMVFITAGMGGGTGTGAAPVIAKLSKELNILTVGIVTTPFQFEGKMRNKQAQDGIEQLRANVDSLIVINNNKLRDVYGNIGFKEGYSKADEVLATAAKGIAEVITHHYLQNIDLRDAKTVLSNSGSAIMGSATASGQNRAQEAIMKALDSPLLNDSKITGAKNVLLLIVSGKQEITIDEIGEINDHIQDEAGHGAEIIMGVGEDDALEESISVTIIATGFDIDQQHELSNTEAKKVVHRLEGNATSKTIESPKAEQKENPVVPQPIIKKEEDTIVRHTLIDEEEEVTPVQSIEDTPKADALELIPTTEVIKNIDVVYEEVIDTTVTIEEEEFIINDITEREEEEDIVVNDEQQITLTFDLPIASTTKESENEMAETQNTEAPIYHHLDANLNEIEVNDYEEISFESKVNVDEPEVKRYVLEEEEDFEKPTVAEEPDAPKLEVKVVAETQDNVPPMVSEEDPLDSPISELMKARASERRKHMKAFNYKFNTAKIDEIEKEPAYKRQGVNLEKAQHSSETNTSRISVGTDENNDIQLRNNNSFLHDNVD